MKIWKEDNLLRRVRESEKVIARNKEHLKQIIDQRIKEFGPNCDLNDIDVSQVGDMCKLFYNSKFNGISLSGMSLRLEI